MVKELRELTGAGMMDSKKALAAVEGDMEKAIEFLREKGLAGAQKKASRIAAEGMVAVLVSADGKKGVAVEVNAETDFVAKNEKFRNVCRRGCTAGAGYQCYRSRGFPRRAVEGRQLPHGEGAALRYDFRDRREA